MGQFSLSKTSNFTYINVVCHNSETLIKNEKIKIYSNVDSYVDIDIWAKKSSYGHVEKYRRDSVVHYLHVRLIDRILTLEKAVTLQDSKGNVITTIMTKDSYKMTALEENQIKLKLFELCEASKINLNKIGKERFLLSDNIEDQVNLDSKSSLIILEGQPYFIKNKAFFKNDMMTELERNEFFEKENTIKFISAPVQEAYNKKRKKYEDLFY